MICVQLITNKITTQQHMQMMKQIIKSDFYLCVIWTLIFFVLIWRQPSSRPLFWLIIIQHTGRDRSNEYRMSNPHRINYKQNSECDCATRIGRDRYISLAIKWHFAYEIAVKGVSKFISHQTRKKWHEQHKSFCKQQINWLFSKWTRREWNPFWFIFLFIYSLLVWSIRLWRDKYI